MLLLSSCWQIFLLDPVKDIHLGTEIFVLNQKLDAMWIYVGAIGQPLLHDEPVRGTASYGDLTQEWFDYKHSTEFVAHEENVFSLIGGVVFLVGSFMVLVARYYELTERKGNTRRHE